jgi:hypothetical protein
VKRDALDDVFSQCVREAADWTCERSGLVFPDRKGRDVHASHFYSRQYNSTRWFPDNVACLSAAEHDYLGKHPDEHTAFIKRRLGDVRYEMLRERVRRIFSYRPHHKAEMRKHFRDELARMLELRRNGVDGPLEFAAYD